MKRHFTLLETLLRYRQIQYILVGIAVLFGIIALVRMPRDEYPEFTIRQGIIVGVYPGATSAQVEDQLTSKVEQYLFQYKSVHREKTYSISKENVMVIYVDVSGDEKDPDAFWAKLRHGLNELKGTLPSGVLSLTADNDFGNTSALLFAVQSDTKSYRELEDLVTHFENDVRRVPSVSRVKHYGLQHEQIGVYLDEAQLSHFAIKPLVVLAALKPQSMVSYAGEIDDGTTIRPIHIPAAFRSEEDVADQIVYSDPLGHAVRVQDVARVVREYERPDAFVRVNGKKCLVVSLEMATGNNIVQFGTDVSEAVNHFRQSLPRDVNVATITDMPAVVSTAIRDFLKEFAISIIVVILVTVLLLPKRVALVAATTIPISILITLGFMWLIGISLQTVSLAVLIVVLGMVVDNAIVIVDNYVEKLDHDITPHDAASQSVQDLFVSVLSATLILLACFMPIPMFLSATARDFTASIPMTVFLSLVISLLVSVLLIPILCYTFIKHGIRATAGKRTRPSMLDRMQRLYDRMVEWAFRNRTTVVALGVLSFVIGCLLLNLTPQQPFPKIERNQFAVEVQLAEGTSLTRTGAVLAQLEDTLRRDKRTRLVTAFVGSGSPRFHTLYAPNFPAKNYGQLIVVTESNEATIDMLDEYSATFTDRWPDAVVKWKQLEMMSTKAPVEVRIIGEDIGAMKKAAEQVAAIARTARGVSWVRTDYKQPLQSVDLYLKRDEASRLGYSSTLLGYALMTGTAGLPVATVWEGDYPMDVRLKVDKPVKTDVREIENQYVTSPFLGASVQVRQLADARPAWTEGEIVRRNGVRTITVLADVKRTTYASKVFDQIRPQVDALTLPAGLRVEYGGEYQDGKENMTPFYYSLGVSVVIIFLILMFQFRSIKTTLLIMMSLPLCIFGAALGVLITGYPFSVTAFIGLIGLMGIIARNGIIYVSYAEELRSTHGLSLSEAAVAAAKRRMRPIFLTSAAAAMGVVPMILSRSSLWGPLGSVICFGLMFGMVLSLVVIPVLYYLFHRKDFEITEEVPAV